MARPTIGERSRVNALTERYTSGWESWNQAIAGLPDSAFETPNITKQWNVKDILGHLLAYQLLYLRHLESIARRGRLASARAPSYSVFNRREAARYQKTPLREMRSELIQAHQAFMARLAQLEDADLKRKYKSAWTRSSYIWTLGGILREEAAHMHAHADEVRRWRAKYQL